MKEIKVILNVMLENNYIDICLIFIMMIFSYPFNKEFEIFSLISKRQLFNILIMS